MSEFKNLELKMIKLKSFFRRGQGTSPSSQQPSHTGSSKSSNLKNSASASSLDRLGVTNTTDLVPGSAGTSRKLSKSKHSSKDRLNELLKSSSKEKLIDEKKELKRQKKQMQQQQQQPHHQSTNLNNNNVPVALLGSSKQSSSSEPHPQPHPRASKDFDLNFDGPKEVSSWNFLNFETFTQTFLILIFITKIPIEKN